MVNVQGHHGDLLVTTVHQKYEGGCLSVLCTARTCRKMVELRMKGCVPSLKHILRTSNPLPTYFQLENTYIEPLYKGSNTKGILSLWGFLT